MICLCLCMHQEMLAKASAHLAAELAGPVLLTAADMTGVRSAQLPCTCAMYLMQGTPGQDIMTKFAGQIICHRQHLDSTLETFLAPAHLLQELSMKFQHLPMQALPVF